MPGERTYVGRVSLSAPDRDALTGVVPVLEDALRTTSWPTRVGDAVLMIRRLDLGVLGRRPSRQAIGALIATRLAALPLVWSAMGSDGDDAPAMSWSSRATRLVHAALVVQRRAPSGTALPWWVLRVLGMSDGRPGEARPALLRAVMALSVESGEGEVIAFLDDLCRHGAPELAAEIAIAVLPELSAPDPALKGLVEAVLERVPQPSTGSARAPREQHARQVLAVLVEDLPAPARRIWNSIVPMPRVRSMSLRARAVLAMRLGRAATAPASAPAHARRVARLLAATGARRTVAVSADAPLRIEGASPAEAAEAHPIDAHATPEPRSQPATRAMARDRHVGPEIPEPHALEQTMAGGIVGLVNLVAQSGIPEADAAHGTDLALSLLRRFLARLPDTQTLRDALPEACHGDADLGGLRCPPNLLAATPKGLRARRTGLCFADGVAGADRMQGDALHNGLMILLSRQLRHITGRGWRHLAMRPALFAVTPTHLDVILDLDDVRIEERRAGLDLSPGWVPWLGRVVTLHFERFDPPAEPVGATP